ncbi:MFS transporter [Microbacterium sp. BWT-B31]|uniref:MFS transporter n=1 Tax=Microbacterium sp. BWT-B31 TaxID=3232072 RepID=UPI0035293078
MNRLRGGWLWQPTVGTLVSQAALGIARPALTYAAISQDANSFTIGLIVAAYGLLPMTLAVPVGRVAGRLRHIGIVPFASAVILIAGCVLPMLWESPIVLIMASALMGTASVGIALGTQAWITRTAAPDNYTRDFGWQSAGASLGQSIGPACAGLLIGPGVLSEDRISLALGAAALLAVVTAAVLASRATRAYEGDDHEVSSVTRTPGILRYIFASTSVLTSIDLITAYLPVIGEQSGIAPTVIGAMLSVRGMTSMLSRLLLGPLARRWNLSTLLMVSTAGSAATVIFVAFSREPSVLFITLALSGVFLGIAQPLTVSAVAAALPPRSRSAGLGVRMFGNQLAQTTVPLVAGALAVLLGVGSIFVIQAVWLGSSSLWEWRARPHPPD